MNSLLIWPVALPLAAALCALVWPRQAAQAGLVAALATAVSALLLVWRVAREGVLVHALGGWEPGLGIALRADALATVMLLMTALVTLGIAVYASGYFVNSDSKARFWPLWLLLHAALNALFLSADLFNVYVTLELLGLSAVALAALGGTREAVGAALRYLTLGLLGSLAFLAGVTLIYAEYGRLDLPGLPGVISPGTTTAVALALMTAGLLLKSALFPLHFWLPPAHANAPAPVSAALSALVIKAGFYLVLRLWLDLFTPAVSAAGAALIGALGAAAVVWGSWNALQSKRLKLLAAYSTVAQLGYLFMFLPLILALPAGTARDTAFGAMILFALTHAFAKSALFLAAGAIQMRAGHDEIARLAGTARALPVTTFTLALAGVALIGLPPSGSFLAKWQLLAAAISTGQWFWVPAIAIGSLLAAAYVFRMLGYAFSQDDSAPAVVAWRREELSALTLAVTATAVLGLGAVFLWGFLAPGIPGPGRMV